MTAFVEAAGGSPQLLLLLILVAAGASALAFGFLPALLLRLSLRCYPPGHERREELAGDFAKIAISRRPAWAASTMVLCLDEGLGARRRARRARRTWRQRRYAAGAQAVVVGVTTVAALYFLLGLPPWLSMALGAAVEIGVFFVGVRRLNRERRMQDSENETR